MQYRRLGRTGLQVSCIGLGGIPIQRVDQAEAVRVVRSALDNGINFIDTARGYTDSEEKIGQALKGVKREEVILATKATSRSAEGILGDVDKSLGLLGVEYIDLYQMHNVKTEEELKRVTGPGGALEGLKKAQRQGKIRYIGVSSHTRENLEKMIPMGIIDTIQVPFNAVEKDTADRLFPLAQQHDVGFIAMKPLAGGALTHAQAALDFILKYPVSVAIPGMDSGEQVEANAQVGAAGFQLPESEKAALEVEVVQLGNAFCRRCGYCQPCPQGIDIPSIFVFDGYWVRYGLKQWAIDRYRALSKHASDCEECGECEEKCPYDLPIREMLKQARAHLE